MRPKYVIRRDCVVGIWDNEETIVRVYADCTVVIQPYVRWINNSGSLAHSRRVITGPVHQSIIDTIAEAELMGDPIDDEVLGDNLMMSLQSQFGG